MLIGFLQGYLEASLIGIEGCFLQIVRRSEEGEIVGRVYAVLRYLWSAGLSLERKECVELLGRDRSLLGWQLSRGSRLGSIDREGGCGNLRIAV